MLWRKANSCSERRFLFWVSFNTESLALKKLFKIHGCLINDSAQF